VNTPLQRTPLYARHIALDGRMVPFAGWEMPVQYKGVTAEHEAVRKAAGLFDVSHMGELFFEGPGAAACLDALVTGDVVNLAVGRALYTVACNERGTILDDLIIYRLAADRLLVVCNASNRDKMHAHFSAKASGCSYQDRSDDTALLALQGPKAASVVQGLAGGDVLVGLARFGVTQAKLAGTDVIAARTGYTGEDGFELFCANGDATRLWDTLMQAGAAHGLQPIGLGARDTLRLEARLSLYGNEIDETTHPLEAGLGWVVKLDKPGFLGRDALLAAKSKPADRKLVGFEMTGRGIARHGYPVVDESGKAIGLVTSGAPGLSIGKNIGLAYVPPALSAIGTPIGIEIRGKVALAKVCATPFYKRTA
jgi:aminomethyltransferase